MQRIAVDLTPVLPGGDNGGAKIMTLNLVTKMADLAPTSQFFLLATDANYLELMNIESSNIKVINITRLAENTKTSYLLETLLSIFYPLIILMPTNLRSYFKEVYYKVKRKLTTINKIKKIANPTLLFCPFTAPFFHDLNVPIISVIYDLQYHHYSYFFTDQERGKRNKHFKIACKHASKLISISNFTKQTIIENSEVAAIKIQTIYISLAKRFPKLDHEHMTSTLIKNGLKNQQFLLYPANFWPHKNHEVLFTAFNIYRAANPNSSLKLVCTGTYETNKNFLLTAIEIMGLKNWIILPGYLSDLDFAALMTGSLAIIYPSLYEGFGMPILEAMAAGKPVLCSNVTSLPEIAGPAALLFDPRNPEIIANAIHRIQNEPELVKNLIQLGYQRVQDFGTEKNMAAEYLQVFQEAIANTGS